MVWSKLGPEIFGQFSNFFFVFYWFKLLSIPNISYINYEVKLCQNWRVCWSSWDLFHHGCWPWKIWLIWWYGKKQIPKTSEEYGIKGTSLALILVLLLAHSSLDYISKFNTKLIERRYNTKKYIHEVFTPY